MCSVLPIWVWWIGVEAWWLCFFVSSGWLVTFAVIDLRWMSLSVDFQITPPLCELCLRLSWCITVCVVLVAVAPFEAGPFFDSWLWLPLVAWGRVVFLWTRGAWGSFWPSASTLLVVSCAGLWFRLGCFGDFRFCLLLPGGHFLDLRSCFRVFGCRFGVFLRGTICLWCFVVWAPFCWAVAVWILLLAVASFVWTVRTSTSWVRSGIIAGFF